MVDVVDVDIVERDETEMGRINFRTQFDVIKISVLVFLAACSYDGVGAVLPVKFSAG